VTEATPEHPQRRFFEPVAGAPTLIGAGSVLEGRIAVPGPLSLSGTVLGNGSIGGTLSVAHGAHWHGNVEAAAAVIAGRVTGDLAVEGKLEIGQSAVVRGTVRARVIAIAEGAVVEGDMSVTGPEPVRRFVEKRAASAY
jgi:cytoskeletal protein CcmA (bactofilin family)